MGYVGNTGYAPGYGLQNNNAANMKIANSALGKAAAADMLGSGIYLDAPARLETCMKKQGGSCPMGYMDYGKMGCCQGASMDHMM